MNEKEHKGRMLRLWLELISTIVMAIGVVIFIVCMCVIITKIDKQNELLSEDTPIIEISRMY